MSFEFLGADIQVDQTCFICLLLLCHVAMVCVCVRACVRACMHVCACVHTCVCGHACLCVSMHVCDQFYYRKLSTKSDCCHNIRCCSRNYYNAKLINLYIGCLFLFLIS